MLHLKIVFSPIICMLFPNLLPYQLCPGMLATLAYKIYIVTCPVPNVSL